MERSVGQFPKHMIEKSNVQSKYFNDGRVKIDSLSRSSQRHVRKMPQLVDMFAHHDQNGFVDLLTSLLTLDPAERPNLVGATDKMDFCIAAASSPIVQTLKK